MAMSRGIAASLLVCLLFLHLVEAGQKQQSTTSTNSLITQTIDCGAACAARCRLASRQRLCKRACETCCARCNCVPPGTSGNQDVCPCYATMTTHGNRRKCP